MRKWMMAAMATMLLLSCGPTVPEQYDNGKVSPKIYPDYADVTIPVNIAPLSFELLLAVDEMVTRFSAEGEELVYGGVKVCPEMDEWKSLTAKAAGKDITVEVFARKDGRWVLFKPFSIHVSPDSIDAYLSYRVIAPSYVSYEELTLNQRCLENYDERVMVDNMLCSTESGGQCVNCHNYQQYNGGRMQFHARETNGGTVIVYDGKVEKVNMANDSLISAGVYPSWHPSLPLIAYSTNKTVQNFHTSDIDKIEVLDAESDLVLYDVERHEITTIEKVKDEFETYPFWSPDGKYLYFSSAHFEYESDSVDAVEATLKAKELKYNIYRKAFDPERRTFGERELVFAADTLGMSATLPRISPDGRWLMFTMGEWGCFHIWHRDADLWLMDLNGNESPASDSKHSVSDNKSSARDSKHSVSDNKSSTSDSTPKLGVPFPAKALNSARAESYHSWSSNGRWVVFSSRRNDGVFTRPYIAHFDGKGGFSKPFELPVENPDFHRQWMKSYNVPELTKNPVEFTPQDFADVLKGEGVKVKYVGKTD